MLITVTKKFMMTNIKIDSQMKTSCLDKNKFIPKAKVWHMASTLSPQAIYKQAEEQQNYVQD